MTAEIWPGSRLSLEGDGAVKAFATGTPDPFVLAFLLLSALTMILFYGRLVAAIRGAVSFCRDAYSSSETLGNNYLCNAIVMTFLLMVPFYAAALRQAGLGRSYLWTFGIVAGLFLLRKAECALFAWLSGRRSAVKSVERVGYGLFLLVALFSFLPVPVLLLFSSEIWMGYRIYLAIIALIGYGIYAKRSFELISSTGFSSFFWVLYLCTLEILPVCVAVNFLMNGN